MKMNHINKIILFLSVFSLTCACARRIALSEGQLSSLKRFKTGGKYGAQLVGSGLEIGGLALAVKDFKEAFNETLTTVQSDVEKAVMSSLSRELIQIIDIRNEYLAERDSRQQTIWICTSVGLTAVVGIIVIKVVFRKMKTKLNLK